MKIVLEVFPGGGNITKFAMVWFNQGKKKNFNLIK